jgi:hypothetical protein
MHHQRRRTVVDVATRAATPDDQMTYPTRRPPSLAVPRGGTNVPGPIPGWFPATVAPLGYTSIRRDQLHPGSGYA